MRAQLMKKGGSFRVVKVDPAHRACKRLFEMGIAPDCEISVENIAPMGDPFLLNVRGYKLAVRRRDLEALEVKAMEEGEDKA